MTRVLTVALVLALVALAVVLALSGCESPAAQRMRAAAEKERAEALAYQIRQQAAAEAAAERANVRQMERDAAHQRALELLPYVLVIVGAGLLAGLAGLLFWDLRSASRAADPGLALYLEQLRLDMAARDRDLWRALAHLNRRSLAAGNGREVTIYEQEPRR